MASNTSKRPADEPLAAPTPTQKRVKADPPVNSPSGALPRHNSAIHSPAGLPTARPTAAREQVMWLKNPPPSRTPITPHPMAIKLFSEVKVCRFQPDS
jgi:hypothetical protein